MVSKKIICHVFSSGFIFWMPKEMAKIPKIAGIKKSSKAKPDGMRNPMDSASNFDWNVDTL